MSDFGHRTNLGEEFDSATESLLVTVAEMREESLAVAGRADHALELAHRFGRFGGEGNKAWLVDQMVRTLAGDDYESFVEGVALGEEGADPYTWDEGTEPVQEERKGTHLSRYYARAFDHKLAVDIDSGGQITVKRDEEEKP